MTTMCADAAGVRLNPLMRRSLMHRRSTPPPSSAWLHSAMHDLREVESFVCDRWDALDASDRAFFRGIVLGAKPDLRFPERLDALWWSFGTFWNMATRREEAVRYLVALHRVLDKINERVGKEEWDRVLNDSDFVAAAERGKREIAAGKAVAYFSGE